MVESDVARQEIPGAVVLVARRGKIGYLESFGAVTPASNAPMPKDAIFRIYSMSKPITAVGAMILVEEGRLKLDNPVSRYLPQFKQLQVVVNGEAESAARPITIQDLLRHMSGLTYGFLHRTEAQKLYARSRLWDDRVTNAEFVDRIAQVPLARLPGTRWDYGHSTDVLGRVIEIVSGQTLAEFQTTRILEPLGMSETSYLVADMAKARIAEPFSSEGKFGNGAGQVEFYDPRLPRAWQSGGAGLVSTAGDYARFLQMLLNGGTLDGRRILAPRTVDYMTADHLGSDIPQPFPGYGWSLGFAVRRDAGVSAMPGSLGDYFWVGAGGTSF